MQGGMHGSAMQDMRQKMAAAKTPEERQALMSEHMKAMHEGMGMMRGMRTDPAWREQMQSQCAEMMKSMNTPPAAK
jgi:cytochrome c556